MKLLTFSISTHLASSLVGCVTAFCVSGFGNLGLSATAFVLSAILVVPLSMFFSTKISIGIAGLEKAVSTGNETHLHATNLFEIDDAAKQIRKYAQRWAIAAERSRSKNQEIGWLTERLNSRSNDGTHGSGRLTKILGGLANSAESNLRKLENVLSDFQTTFNQQTTVFEDQSDVVSKATIYVEQLSINIADVPESISAAQRACSSIVDTSSEINRQVETLTSGLKAVQSDVETNERRFRALAEQYREIGSIAEAIGEISARTDMLALNVSLEAVRAGQSSRGFSVLAEEVRKLSEQTAQAAREVAGLVESLQFKTQESINGILQQKTKLGIVTEQSKNISNSISQVCESAGESGKNLLGLSNTSGQQIKLTHDLIGSVERLSETSRDGRRRLEASSLGLGGLFNATEQLQLVFQPLKSVSNWRAEHRPFDVDSEALSESHSEFHNETTVLI